MVWKEHSTLAFALMDLLESIVKTKYKQTFVQAFHVSLDECVPPTTLGSYVTAFMDLMGHSVKYQENLAMKMSTSIRLTSKKPQY